MAYVPGKTWIAGDALSATDVAGNDRTLRTYLQKLPDSALDASAWVTERHVVRGYYQPITNQIMLTSGTFGGQTWHMDQTRYSYATSYTSNRDANTSNDAAIPATACNFEVHCGATLFVQYWLHPVGRGNATFTGITDVHLYLGNTTLRQGHTIGRVLEEDNTTANYPEWLDRHQCCSFDVVDLSVGTYAFGLLASSTPSMAKVQCIAFGITFELFYL